MKVKTYNFKISISEKVLAETDFDLSDFEIRNMIIERLNITDNYVNVIRTKRPKKEEI